MKAYKVLSLLVLLIGLLALLGLVYTPYDPYVTNEAAILQAPSMAHWLGTDMHGRDVLSRIMAGASTSIYGSLFIVLMAMMIGTVLGALAAYKGGWMDAVIMRLTDLFLAFPDFLLAITVAGVLGGGLSQAIIAIIATSWTQYARLSRALVKGELSAPYMTMAKLSGVPLIKQWIYYILPNMGSVILITGLLHIATTMMMIAGLSFIGLGVQVPEPEWGAMISDGVALLPIAPWVSLAPSLALALVMCITNAWGDAMRDYLDKGDSNE
ncbi:MAG: ABC transporter permease [Veillonella sp.]|nr:ABC transporter permease [Veillonella sp.]